MVLYNNTDLNKGFSLSIFFFFMKKIIIKKTILKELNIRTNIICSDDIFINTYFIIKQ